MLENDDGTDFLPMRLMTVLVISSLVIVSAVVYTSEIIGQSSKAAAKACASKIVATAATEYAESCPGCGDGTLIDVSVPESVYMMTFGPGQANGLTEGPGTYSIRYTDGSDQTYIVGTPLGSGCPGQGRGRPLVLYPGSYSIRISTEEVNGSMMALIYVEGK